MPKRTVASHAPTRGTPSGSARASPRLPRLARTPTDERIVYAPDRSEWVPRHTDGALGYGHGQFRHPRPWHRGPSSSRNVQSFAAFVAYPNEAIPANTTFLVQRA